MLHLCGFIWKEERYFLKMKMQPFLINLQCVAAPPFVFHHSSSQSCAINFPRSNVRWNMISNINIKSNAHRPSYKKSILLTQKEIVGQIKEQRPQHQYTKQNRTEKHLKKIYNWNVFYRLCLLAVFLRLSN